MRSSANRGPRKNDQFGHLAAIERQFHDSHVVDHLPDTGVPCFYQRRVRLNLDGLGNLTHCHYNVDFGITVDLQHDSCLHKCTETRQACF